MTASQLRKSWLPLAGLLSLALGNPAQASLAISNKATKNVTCSAGVCTATAKLAAMNVGDLTSMLASSDVTLVSGSAAKDIEAKVPFSWASAHRLTLDAYRSIAIDKLVTVAGTGALTFTTNDGGTNGTLTFSPPGRTHFWDLNSSLVINGASYTLVGDIATLASDIAGNPSGHYALADNYDASIDGTYAHSPIPTSFSGAFQGLGNTITRLRIQNKSVQEDMALFSALAAPGDIENVLLTHVAVTGGKTKSAGGLVAVNSGYLFADSVEGLIRQLGNGGSSGELAGSNLGNVSHCHSSGSVQSSSYQGAAGGLIGLNASALDQSDSSAAVTSSTVAYLGGLVGQSNGGTISGSFASGAVSGPMFAVAGGLLGYSCCNAGTLIANSNATGAVSGATAGGLAGVLDVGAAVTNSYASGTVMGRDAGGLVGFSAAGISASHATGIVNGSHWAGGLAGASSGSIVNSYASGAITLSGADAGGGLVGSNNGTVSGSFATGTVQDTTGGTYGQYVGGLVGYDSGSTANHAVIANSYSTGAVDGVAGSSYVGGLAGGDNDHSFVSDSYTIGDASNGVRVGGFLGVNRADSGHDANDYWDTTTSGASKGVGHGNADGVTGLTSAELQSGLPAGFDPAIWAENPAINGGYPYLIANPPPN
jgi:hypothetical protein